MGPARLQTLFVLTMCYLWQCRGVELTDKTMSSKNRGSGPIAWLNVGYKDVQFDKVNYWGLTDDGIYIDKISAFGVAKRMYKLPLPGTMMAVTDNYLAVMHKGYMSTVNLSRQDAGNVTTFSVPVEGATSVMVTGNKTYFFTPRTSYQFGKIFCSSINGGKVTEYDQYVGWGSAAFLHPSGKLFYSTIADQSPDGIVKFNISSEHCEVGKMNENPFAEYSCGQRLWYSFDGTRIFLDNGRTLWSSADKSKDLKVHGCMNSVCDKTTYTGFTQAAAQPNTIYALQRDSAQVFSYTWPYLNADKVFNITGIPKTDTPQYTYELVRVDWAEPGQIHVFVSRTEKATSMITSAVVYIAV